MSNDYAPIPDADLETAFMELLAEVRKHSTSGSAAEHAAKEALEEMRTLAATTERRYKQTISTHSEIMQLLDMVKTMISEINSREKKTLPKKIEEFLGPIAICFSALIIFMFLVGYTMVKSS
ncbi:MAG: hypothetical protein ABF727_13570 [Gluconobacter oxydans]